MSSVYRPLLSLTVLVALTVGIALACWRHSEPNRLPAQRSPTEAPCASLPSSCGRIEDIRDYDIPRSTLNKALQLFSTQSGIAIGWDMEQPDALMEVGPVTGSMAADQVLARLVAGTRYEIDIVGTEQHPVAFVYHGPKPDSPCHPKTECPPQGDLPLD